MNAMCSLSPISLQIAPLWMWLMSAWWFNMVIPPAALASPGVEFVVLAIKATFDQQLRSIVNSTIPIKLECLTARANAGRLHLVFSGRNLRAGACKGGIKRD